MEFLNETYIYGGIAIILSIAFILTVLFVNPIKKGRFTGRKKIILVSGLLIFSIWFLRMAIAINNRSIDTAIACLIDTLQTFSLDAEYHEYIASAKEVITNIPGLSEFWVSALTVYVSLIYVAAPITGGAVLFEIIASIFPRIKLFFSSMCVWKEIVYFSELNEQSLALAKSIRENARNEKNWLRKPIIVFTDVYTDDEEEKSTELLLSAKALGAICINDDILHTHIRYRWKKKMFLIDKNEVNNIQTLTALSTESRYKLLDGADVFLFSNDDTFALVGYKIKEELKNKSWAKKMPRIISVNGYRNLVRNLLSEVPLYEPLVEKTDAHSIKHHEEDRQLNVTIIGAGDIGTEMFLSTYWYGQILNYQLNINVISQEPEEVFIDKINYINPDIFDTCVRSKTTIRKEDTERLDSVFSFDGSTNQYSKIMRKYPDDKDTSVPYFRFRYFQTNLKDDDLESKLSTSFWSDGFKIIDSDYFLVALGSDADNLSVADKLNRFVSISKLESSKRKHAVIAYVVYDSDLCRVLNEQQKNAGLLKNFVYMHAFGSLEEVFNTKNIYMEENEGDVERINDAYERAAQRVVNKKFNKSQYDYWSDIARALHIKYKVFSAGFIKDSVFNCSNVEIRKDRLGKALEEYKKSIIPYEKDNENSKKKKSNSETYVGLTWLEHRRWNAFMRVNGFRCPNDFTLYCRETKEHKNMELKLHPCLVESDSIAVIDGLFDDKSENKYDYLDEVSIKISNALGKKTNYKMYDCPGFDFECNELGEIIK